MRRGEETSWSSSKRWETTNGTVRIRNDSKGANWTAPSTGPRPREADHDWHLRHPAGSGTGASAISRRATRRSRSSTVRPVDRTVGDFAETWWKTRAGRRSWTSASRDRQALDRDVLPFFRDAPLSHIDQLPTFSSGSRNCRSEWLPRPCDARRSSFDGSAATAVERGAITSSPTEGIKLPTLARPESRFLTPTPNSKNSRPRSIPGIGRWCW